MSQLFIFNGEPATGKSELSMLIARNGNSILASSIMDARIVDTLLQGDNPTKNNLTIILEEFSCCAKHILPNIGNKKPPFSECGQNLLEFLNRKGTERRFERGIFKNIIIVTTDLTKEFLDKLNEVAGRYLNITVCDFKRVSN